MTGHDDDGWLPATARANAELLRPRDGLSDELPGDGHRRARGGGRAQLALTFEHPNGDSETLWYSHVYRMTLTGGNTLVIRFSDDAVTLTGRNLRLLRNLILSEMQDVVAVTPRDRDLGRDGGWAVYGIVIEPLRPPPTRE